MISLKKKIKDVFQEEEEEERSFETYLLKSPPTIFLSSMY